MAIKCILFDRDGTLGALGDKRYPQTLMPYASIKSVFDNLKAKGYFVGIITNQSSIARGTASGYDFDAEFLGYGADAWEICPHDNDDHCSCRKPKSGLLTAIAKKLNVSPTECLVVGDRLSDIQCAKNVGAEAALVLTGYGENEKEAVLAHAPKTLILQDFTKVLTVL